MNIGNNILQLRKNKNVTQEALAAELGVTAAAVSKWENGYALPDILMLCALADYFQVTTDEILGRTAKPDEAIVLAETEELGQKISVLLEKYNIKTSVILTDRETAFAVAAYEEAHNKGVKYLFDASHLPNDCELEKTNEVKHIHIESDNWSDESVLSAVELYLNNMDSIDRLAERIKDN